MSEIDEALTEVMKSVSHVAKRDVNQHQRFNFRGIDAVVNAVGPALREHGVKVMPECISATYETVQTTTGKPSTACRVQMKYVFSAEDGSERSCSVFGEAWDAGDKATPKAMSVAFRTALLQALCLPTDEPDPDAHTYERSEPDERQAKADAFLIERYGEPAQVAKAMSEAGLDAHSPEDRLAHAKTLWSQR